MRDLPLNVILSFPPANYKNPHTRGPALIIVNSIFLALVIIFVALRMYTRIRIVRTFGWDDASLLVGFVFAVGLAANVMLANNVYYWDRHIWDIPLTAAAALGKAAMSAKVLFTVAVTFIRFALLLFYFRLVNDTSLKRFKWALHGTVYFNFVIFIVFTFLAIFQCRPVSAYWKLGQSDKCMDEGKVTLAAGIVNCIADLLVTALPIPIIMKLHMPLPQRMGVAFLLSLGFMVTIAGVVRTYFIWKALMDSYDETWYAYPLWISAAVEVQLAVITACIPPLRPLFAMYLPGFSNPIVTITDRLNSALSGSKGSTPGHSANQTKPLSAVHATVTTEAEPYHPVDIEKLQSQKRVSTAVFQKNSKKVSWHIMRQQSIEVTRNPMTPTTTIDSGARHSGIYSWPKSPGLSSSTTSNNKSPTSKRFSKVFTKWWGTSSSSHTGSGSVSTDDATLHNPMSPALLPHPLRNDSSLPQHEPMRSLNDTIQRPFTASAEIPEKGLMWPLKEPYFEQHEDGAAVPVKKENRRRTASDGDYHRVEIRKNPFNATSEVAETIDEKPGVGGRADDRGAQSRATTLTTQWA